MRETIFLTMMEVEKLYPLVDAKKFEGLSYFLRFILDEKDDMDIDAVVPVGVSYIEKMYLQDLLANKYPSVL